MKQLDIEALYQSLRSVNWYVAVRTFGSSHATLIGLLVEWWIRQDPEGHSALDGAPSHGKENAGWCDVMFCRNGTPAGVLEVEGTKPLEKLKTIGNYFGTKREEMSSIQFGMLLLYSYGAKGRGSERTYPPAETADIYAAAIHLSSNHPSKPVILLALDKRIDIHESQIRAVSPYYAGITYKISAVLLRGGCEARRELLFESVHSEKSPRGA